MRQLTILKDEPTAQRFAAWLVTQKIEAHAEQEKEGWAVWVREEDQLAAAKEQLAQFKLEPDHPRYRNAPQQAAALEREEQQKRAQAQKNTIEMSRNWGSGMTAPRSQPVVMSFIFASVLVFVLTNWGEQTGPGLRATLQICDGISQVKDGRVPFTFVWKNLLQGEIWRLITPMFLHFAIMHIAFNLLIMYDFGGQVESRLKSGWFLLLVVVIAIVAHAGQALVDSVQLVDGQLRYYPYFPSTGNFGGMSGVNYGLFGFIFVRSRYRNDSGYMLRPETTLIMFAWLVFCIARNFFSPEFGGNLPYVANTAHVAGLLAGMALAFVKKPGA